MRGKATEDEIHKSIVQFLKYRLPDAIIHHSPNEGRSTINWKMRQKSLGTVFGWPDLEVFVPNFSPIFIEVKRPKAYLNANQKAVKQLFDNLNLHYFVCRSVDDVMHNFCMIGVFRV